MTLRTFDSDIDQFLPPVAPPEYVPYLDRSGLTPVDPTLINTILAMNWEFCKTWERGKLDILVGAGKNIKEFGCMVIDYELGMVTLATTLGGRPVVFEPWSGALNSLDSGDISTGGYYANAVPNILTFGVYGQCTAVYNWWDGNITDTEMREQVGGPALLQLIPGAMKHGPKLVTRTCVIEKAMYAQKTYSPRFGTRGTFKGKTIDEIAQQLRNNEIKPSDVPIEYAILEGDPIILNTRSAMALERAGVPRNQWVIKDVTNNPDAILRLQGQLSRNDLSPPGYPKPVQSPQ